MDQIELFASRFADLAWGPPLLVLLVGGGIFFLIYSRFTPFLRLGHAVAVLRGQQDQADGEGHVRPAEALAIAISSTVGLGNIGGVAVAIAAGGPGAIFWMWISALLGMATEFFTSSLAVMYRGKDSQGALQGGPMYVIREGMGPRWRPLAIFFCLAGLIGSLPLFQANQLVQTLVDLLGPLSGIPQGATLRIGLGALLALLIAGVVLGGIRRIGATAGKLAPLMVGIYGLAVLAIMVIFWEKVPGAFALIFRDAFTGQAAMGGSVGSLILLGVRRAAFSNEAGIGTTSIAHGAARTSEPIREGLVAMLGPAIDTLVVCTVTALALLVTDAYLIPEKGGISLTLAAFDAALGPAGVGVLGGCIVVFAFTTMFSMSFYGAKCCAFLFGVRTERAYLFFYLGSIVFGASATLPTIINLIDGMYALMAFPTMISAIWLAPKVKLAAERYFDQLKQKTASR